MIVLGLTEIGDRTKAEAAVAEIAGKLNLSVPEAARAIFEKTCQGVASAVSAMIEEINNKPVYTIHELLEGKEARPQEALHRRRTCRGRGAEARARSWDARS